MKVLLKKRKSIAIITIILLASMAISLFGTAAIFGAAPAPVLLDPKIIPKYVNQLVVPPVFTPDVGFPSIYTVEMVNNIRQQILPTLPAGTIAPIPGDPSPADGKTAVWGYQGNAVAKGDTLTFVNPAYTNGYAFTPFVWSPSATFEAVRGTPTTVKWVNKITANQPFAVDPTLYWANPWKPNDNNPNADVDKMFPDGDAFSKTGAMGGAFLTYPPGYNGEAAGFPPYNLNAQFPVPLVPHLHGAEVAGEYDGGPESWWTAAGAGGLAADQNLKGPNYHTEPGAPAGQAWYVYPNSQEPTTLWYHDHALGITRLNVMSGLAGFYLLRNSGAYTQPPAGTPLDETNLDQFLRDTFKYGISEIPLAIQDRSFKTNGEFWFPEVGLNPTIHPYWMPEFFGNTIMVNGLVWPNLDVTPGWYRFRLLDGSNARFYTLSFDNNMPFTVIGMDGGYLQAPTTVSSITIAPGERSDILVQFTNKMIGKKILLKNTAKGPFPNGAAPDPKTTGQIMQFTVWATPQLNGVTGVPNGALLDTTQFQLASLPTTGLNPTLGNPTLPGVTFPTTPGPAAITKIITLNEVMGPAGPVMVMINGQYYHGQVEPVRGQGTGPLSPNPDTTLPPPVVAPRPLTGTYAPVTSVAALGTTEEWVIVNLTADTHPIHLHLVTFQLVSRQAFQAGKYQTAWLLQQTDPITKNPLVPPFPEYYEPLLLDPIPYLQGAPIFATPEEKGWKDTIQMHPGQVTTIRVRFTGQDGLPFDGFDPRGLNYPATAGPGYVYHCHIIDHEDNEMMRPLIIK